MTDTAAAHIPPKRLKAAQAALDAYADARGFSDLSDSDTIDLITDLLHLAAQNETETLFGPHAIHRVAWMHYAEETGQ